MFAKNSEDQFYCWGDNDTGRLGLGENKMDKDVKPIKNEYLSNKKIVQLFCGREESVSLTENEQVYFWLHVEGSGFQEKLIKSPALRLFTG